VLDLIRASALLGFPELVRTLGGHPERLLAQSRIDAETVGDTEAFVSYHAFAEVLHHAAIELDCPDFGLRLSTHQGLEILGPVALIARYATSVGEGLVDVARYLYVYSPAMSISAEPISAKEVRFTLSILATDLPDRIQAEELSLGVSLRALRLLIGERFRPLRVAITHKPLSEPVRYRDFFDADVRFEQPHCGFDLNTDDLHKSAPRNDPVVRELALRYLNEPAASSTGAPVTALRALIARMLPTGNCTITTVAREFAIHPRTLQRQLASEGLTFDQTVDSVRRDQARHYLETTTMPLSQLSAMLGYSEQSSLSRACRNWFGQSPREIRRSLGVDTSD
jgi:AraC-like DNA-binding protein